MRTTDLISLVDEYGVVIHPATEEKQDSIVSAIQAIPGGGDATNYTTRFDEGATYAYVGKAVPGTAEASALWRIQRFPVADYSAGLYADGNANLDNVWTNRASLSYS